MNKAELFLFDFVTKRKIIRTGIEIILFFAISFYYHSSNPAFMISTGVMSSIGLSMAFLTTLYSILSYSTMNRIRAYLMLPYKKSEVFFSFIFAQLFVLLLERMSFVIIVVALFVKMPVLNITYLIISAIVAVVLDTAILISMNKKQTFYLCCFVVLVAGLYTLLILSRNHVLNFWVLLCIFLIGTVCLLKANPKNLAVNREGKVRNNRLRQMNYFFIVLLREKSTLINTVFVFIFASVFMAMSKETPILSNMVWCIVAVNTPVSTMFSGDKYLSRHEKMLPQCSHLMYGIYGLFVMTYFAIANSFALLLFAAMGKLSIVVIVTGTVLVIFETVITLLLERKYPIRSWQTKQEVWKNPRKYILPIGVFTVAIIPYLLSLIK
ncbi:hypothetical protein [Enterococcus nangangensis]|uniref:hypothetical protein n=1 Tax=Enterococcus nangangensis TaxID=2559926 RepID=UPI0010F5EECC|nr:hypothetical protein [Enterococcus nangangensis]